MKQLPGVSISMEFNESFIQHPCCTHQLCIINLRQQKTLKYHLMASCCLRKTIYCHCPVQDTLDYIELLLCTLKYFLDMTQRCFEICFIVSQPLCYYISVIAKVLLWQWIFSLTGTPKYPLYYRHCQKGFHNTVGVGQMCVTMLSVGKSPSVILSVLMIYFSPLNGSGKLSLKYILSSIDVPII